MRRIHLGSAAMLVIVPMLFWSRDGSALPVFARKYHTACSTCHTAFPIRNGFGEAFRNNGYRFPGGQDEDMVKEEPIKLGQEGYKKQFPEAIWPSDMPNMPSLGFVGKIRAYTPKDAVTGNFNKTQIAEDLETFFAGTITDNITYFGDFAINAGDPNGTGQIEWGKLNLLWTFRPGMNLVFGEVGPTERMVLLSARPGWKRDGYSTTMPAIGRGVELRIAGDTGSTGGYSLVTGIGKNAGFLKSDGITTEKLEDKTNFGDMKFARATFKIGGHGLLSGTGGSHGVDHIGMDNAITFGVNVVNSLTGSSPASQESDTGLGMTKNAYSCDVEATYGSMRLLGMYARFNEVVKGDVDYGRRNAYSLEGDYWFYPWLIGGLRYENFKDGLNGEVKKIIPFVAAMLRPNAKIGFEYVDVTHTNKLAVSGYSAPTNFQFFTQVGF